MEPKHEPICLCSQNHNSYVRNYITTGQKRMIGIENSFVAMHKVRYSSMLWNCQQASAGER